MSEHRTVNGTFFVVKDPVTGGFFRLREVEIFIARQFDGVTTLDAIRERVEKTFEAALPLEMLEAFVANLEKKSLLESADGTPPKKAKPPGRIRGSVLYFRLALFDPDRLFTWINERVSFFYTKKYFIASSILIFCAFAIALSSGGEILRDFRVLFRPSTIPVAFAASLILLSAHEFAHGVTCKHFGGEVHEVGFMVMYFQPFFYCNVSDAWLFPEKSKRLWVGFAGPQFELFLWAIALIVWRVTEIATTIHYVALLVVAISGVKSLFDLNPFLKLDGYYLLSDYLEIPNLRRRAYAFVGDKIRWALGLARNVMPPVTPRERPVLLGYGLVATVSSILALTFGVIKAGGFLIAHHQPLALLGLTSYASMRSRRRFRRLFGGAPDASDPMDDGGTMGNESGVETPAPVIETIHHHHKHRHHRPRPDYRRALSRAWKKWLRWVALGVASLVFLFAVPFHARIGGPFAVLPEANADVRAAIDGIITEVRVDEGAQVKKGDVIAQISDKDLRADFAQSSASVAEARADLAKLQAGPSREDLAIARADLDKQESATKFATSRAARLKTLLDRNMASPQDYDDAEAQARMAQSELAAARSRVDSLVRGSRAEDVARARAQLDGLTSRQQHLGEQLHLFTVVSPATGVVATPSRELHAMRGKMVSKGELIAKVFELKTVAAQIVVPEQDIGEVHPGQPVVLRLRAYPERAFHGKVTSIATAADGSSGNEASPAPSAPTAATAVKSFVVTTEIDNESELLKPGMTGQAKIIGRTQRAFDALARRVMRTFKVEVWSWW